MRLHIPEMQALTARFRALAEEHGGTYDNWAVERVRMRGRSALGTPAMAMRWRPVVGGRQLVLSRQVVVSNLKQADRSC
jgi:hypothetical protein